MITDQKTLSTTLLKQTTIYLISFFLPPLGLWYGFKYLRQDNEKAKRIGLIAIFLTVISLALTFWISLTLINNLNQSFKNQTAIPDLNY